MTHTTAPTWEAKQTDETRMVERVLRDAGFEKVDAYRYNSASIRVRVIDQRFEGMPTEKRDAMVEPYLERLPDARQADIMNLFTSLRRSSSSRRSQCREFLKETEFEDPSPSML